MPICKSCGIEKVPELFYSTNKTTCKSCVKERAKARYYSEDFFYRQDEISEYTQEMCDLIEHNLDKYPPNIRPLMEKQLEMYKLGEYEADTMHMVHWISVVKDYLAT